MKRKFLRAAELILLLAFLSFLAVVLYPIFAKPDSRPVGVVQDGTNKPMPGAALHFRDGAGRLVASFTADAQGEFRSRELGDLRRDAVDGFALTHETHFTGGINHYYFSPLGTQTAFFHDKWGRPVASLNVLFRPVRPYSYVTPEELEGVSDQNGTVQFNNLPSGARYDVDIWSGQYAIRGVWAFSDVHSVRYDVTVIPAAIIAGRLTNPNGKPLIYYNVLANSVSGAEGYRAATTNPRGRFQIAGLRPGPYRITVTSSGVGAHGPEDVFARTFILTSGQTIDVSLHYRPGHGAEAASLSRH